MKNLNQKTVEHIASVLKTDPAKLTEHLQTDIADTSKQETKVGELLTGINVLSNSEKERSSPITERHVTMPGTKRSKKWD